MLKILKKSATNSAIERLKFCGLLFFQRSSSNYWQHLVPPLSQLKLASACYMPKWNSAKRSSCSSWRPSSTCHYARLERASTQACLARLLQNASSRYWILRFQPHQQTSTAHCQFPKSRISNFRISLTSIQVKLHPQLKTSTCK